MRATCGISGYFAARGNNKATDNKFPGRKKEEEEGKDVEDRKHCASVTHFAV